MSLRMVDFAVPGGMDVSMAAMVATRGREGTTARRSAATGSGYQKNNAQLNLTSSV
jgi:hypothetical protein